MFVLHPLPIVFLDGMLHMFCFQNHVFTMSNIQNKNFRKLCLKGSYCLSFTTHRGLEVWRIENIRPVLVPNSFHGKFFTGDSYLILKTSVLKSETLHHEIHYWIGQDTSQDEAGYVATMALELDTALGRHAVQYRELQGHETDKFLSYFKPCIIPQKGKITSQFKHLEVNTNKNETRLYVCNGKHSCHVKEVAFARSSLNHDEIFILDTKTKVFQFNGFNSSIQERAKALEVVQYIKDTFHDTNCEVAVIEDGKLMSDADAGEFWGLFGGFAPLRRRAMSHNDNGNVHLVDGSNLFCVEKGHMSLVKVDSLTKELLDPFKCYVLDCGIEVFVWMGISTSLQERKRATSVAEKMLYGPHRTRTQVICMTDGFETSMFKLKLDKWRQFANSTAPKDDTCKAVDLPKLQGLSAKCLTKTNLEQKEPQPYIDCTGSLQIWRIDGHEKFSLSSSEPVKFYSGECYIFEYSYIGGEDIEEYLIGTWFGKKSSQEERSTCISLATMMFDSLKHQAVQARIFEKKEPIQFFAIFQSLIICKGGNSSGYKKFIDEDGIADDTYTEDGLALFLVQGYGAENMQAVQVEPVASSLNSCYCYILHNGGTVLGWTGSLTTVKDHELLERQLDAIKPNLQPELLIEGAETEQFWDFLGGKSEYMSQKGVMQPEKDPHLFSCTLSEGNLKVLEIFNFSQDDLFTEDIFILDNFFEIFVWVGNQADLKSKIQALTIGEDFLEHDFLLEKRSQETPIFIIMEGCEPTFFTRFFSWDFKKASMLGDSFQRKLAIMTNRITLAIDKPKRRSSESYGGRSYMADKPRRSRSTSFSPDRVRVRGRSPVLNKLAAAFENPTPTPSPTTPTPRNLSNPPPVARKVPYPKSQTFDYARLTPKSTAITRSSSYECKTENPVLKSAIASRSYSLEYKAENPVLLKSSKGGSLDSLNLKPYPKSNGGATTSKNISRRRESHATREYFEELEDEEGLPIFPYECLKTSSLDPVREINVNRREAYLSASEFKKIFGMSKDSFKKLPKWKQLELKMNVQLF